MHVPETSFEQALDEAADAADWAVKSAADVAKSARKARKAALDGDISVLGRCPEDLARTLGNLRRSVAALEQAVSCAAAWPPTGEHGQPSFRDRYSAELRDAAATDGLGIHERDGALISFPTIVRIESDRSLTIDQKRIRALRPSRVVGLLRDGQARLGRYKPERFLEALHFVYEDILKDQRKTVLAIGTIPPMPLGRIYKHLTALPGVSREYTKTGFRPRSLHLGLQRAEARQEGQGPQSQFSVLYRHSREGVLLVRGP